MDNTDKTGGIGELRLACRQFAMLYFHFCKTLVEALGEEAALGLAQRAVFTLALDRTDRTRAKALAQGLEPALENFPQVNDLPLAAWEGWKPEMGGCRCPYAETWLGYFEAAPWFKPFASLYCDVIDTTNIENFSRTTSHRIKRNLLWGDPACEREYFESGEVKRGIFTYGKRE
ncbi:MAG: L-2-amino-thiazoline-4-carboxylic acid hydrolase [Treponema sp.]|nr:L-2-amino-thiazoline-4-carboxylic acid hydrolase [Treponema sp.]